jgi:hypothetical protein
MIVHALALVLASAPTLSVKVVSLNFSYPYFGEPGNTCQKAGSVYVHAVANSTPVVVRMVDSAGLSVGSEAVLDDVRLAGKGKDGTVVYCAAGRLNPSASTPVQPVAGGVDASAQPPPLVQASAAEPSQPAVAAAPSPAPAVAATGCTARLFNIIKKSMGEKKFGPSEFDSASAQGEPEVVDCSLARSRNTNVLLIKMVKDGIADPATVVGAEWGPGSKWQNESDAQRRVVKVYVAQ